MLSYVMVEHNPSKKPIDKVVIWLHGLGASGDDFVPCVPHLGLADDLAIKFIFPNAPKIAVTINGGYVMPAWYDILQMNLERVVDIHQIQASSLLIDELVKHEMVNGIDSKNIIIAGFSQGGAVAYDYVLTSDIQLGGLLALSTYFASKDYIQKIKTNCNIPTLIHHGQFDDIVPMTLGMSAKQSLEQLGLTPQFVSYPMAHQVTLSQLQDIGTWFNQIFSKNADKPIARASPVSCTASANTALELKRTPKINSITAKEKFNRNAIQTFLLDFIIVSF